MELNGRVAIVTGATGTIGRGICITLAAQGMKLVIVDLDQKLCDSFAEELTQKGYHAFAVAVDVTSRQATRELADKVVKHFGSIDVLVNNAGIIALGSLCELDEDAWDRVIDVNLKGTFLCAQAVVPTMIPQRRGKIINVSSVAAARPAPLQSAYAATKSGVLGLTKVWCQELAQFNVTVNTVCPGFVDSSMWSDHLGPAYSEIAGADSQEVLNVLAKAHMPLGRPQSPEDLGEAVAYLCGADNVTGQTLFVDGGFTMA